MPFKLERFLSRVDLSHTALALAAGLLFSSTGFASLSVSPVRYDGTILSNLNTIGAMPTAYYPSNSTGLDSSDTSVPQVVSTVTQSSDSSGGQNAIYFKLSSTTASYTTPTGWTSTPGLYVMAFVGPVGSTSTSSFYPVPIAYYNQGPYSSGTFQSCQNGSCTLQGSGYSASMPTYYFAAPYAVNTSVQIGVYLSDICNLYAGSASAVTSNACSGTPGAGSFSAPASGSTTGLVFKFYIAQITNGSTFNNPQSVTDSSHDSSQINLTSDSQLLAMTVQGDEGTITGTCPDQNSNLYFPGDQSISLKSRYFQNIFSNSTITTTTGGGAAPAGSLLITYEKSASCGASPTAPSTSGGSSFPNPSDPVLARNIALGDSDQNVPNFINSTETCSTYYDLAIYIRDLAGYVSTNACSLNSVRTAQIEGFLKESKCFIATAAYRSKDAAPVRMLRQFRDQILLQFDLGQRFVSWYYRWSPPAAEWLLDHSEFRYPVLLALVPVEIVAWLCLRPILGLLFVSLVLGLFVLFRKRASQARTHAPEGESIG